VQDLEDKTTQLSSDLEEALQTIEGVNDGTGTTATVGATDAQETEAVISDYT